MITGISGFVLDGQLAITSLTLDQLELPHLAAQACLELPWKRKLLLSKLSMVAELVLSSFDVHLGSFFRKQPRSTASHKVEAWGPHLPTGR